MAGFLAYFAPLDLIKSGLSTNALRNVPQSVCCALHDIQYHELSIVF